MHRTCARWWDDDVKERAADYLEPHPLGCPCCHVDTGGSRTARWCEGERGPEKLISGGGGWGDNTACRVVRITQY